MGLSLQWVMFGSSGIRDRPETGGPLQHFDKCLDELSHDMKCFASSYHLADYPFIGPEFIHSCCYQYAPGFFVGAVITMSLKVFSYFYLSHEK